MHSFLKRLFGVCLVLGALTLASCATGPTRPPSPSLVEALRAGGNVIYIRHVTADVGRDVPGTRECWKKCDEVIACSPRKGRLMQSEW